MSENPTSEPSARRNSGGPRSGQQRGSTEATPQTTTPSIELASRSLTTGSPIQASRTIETVSPISTRSSTVIPGPEIAVQEGATMGITVSSVSIEPAILSQEQGSVQDTPERSVAAISVQENSSRIELLSHGSNSRPFPAQAQELPSNSDILGRGSTRSSGPPRWIQTFGRSIVRRWKYWISRISWDWIQTFGKSIFRRWTDWIFPIPWDWKIHFLWILFLLAITVSLMFTIITLDVISSKEGGFTPLWDPPTFLIRLPAFENNIWSQGVLYTSLPAFFMTLYTMMFSSTVDDFMDRQPYVDLKKPGGAPARTTILLDYHRYPTLYGFMVAFRNNHELLGYYMLLCTALTVAVVPLTAFLFISAPFNTNSTVPVSFMTVFDDTGILALPDMGLMINFASAFCIYDASPPAWTDGEYAFPTVVAPDAQTDHLTNGNLTVNTTAHSAYIDCRTIPESNYTLDLVDRIGDNNPAITIRITADDRGCGITGFFNIIPSSIPGQFNSSNTIMRFWTTLDCRFEAGYTRLSFFSGQYSFNDETGLQNSSLISCIPSYWTTPGALTINMNPNALTETPSIELFAANNEQALQSRNAVSTYFEFLLMSVGYADTTSYIDGYLYPRNVYLLALKNSPESPLLPQVISEAAQTLFTSIYATIAATTAFAPLSQPSNSTGTRTTNVTRLIVVVPVAYTILIILFGIVVALVTMLWYGRRETILIEEPKGMLGKAALIHGSNLLTLMTIMREQSGYEGRMIEALENWGIGKEKIVGVEQGKGWKIVVRDLEIELR